MVRGINYNGLSVNGSSGSGSNSDDMFYEVGQTIKESISKITILADAREQQMLQRLDRDYKAFAKGIQSALNDTSYFREGIKSVDPATGRSYIEYYVQTSEAKNAFEALRQINSRLVGTHYELRMPQEMDYITGTRTFEGKQAQAKALYEIARKGGKLLPTPTADNPDQYTYMLPFSKDWAQGVGQEDYLNYIFTDSDVLSKLEHDKRASEAEVDRNYAKAKKAEMIKKLSLTQSKEAGSVWEQFEREEKQKELAQLKDNYAQAKQLELMDALSASQSKEAGSVWEQFEREEERKRQHDIDVNYQANKRIKRENAQKEAEEKREAEKRAREAERQQAKDSLTSKTKRMFLLGQIASMFTVLLDLTRRILANGLAMASDAKRTEREARNIGASYGAMLNYNYTDQAFGLPEGTTSSALFAIQSMFGDPANLDTKALDKLAMIMGNSVGDAVRSGLGGKNPEKLIEMIMDAFIKSQQAGVNQFGEQVGKEEARRNLYTLLAEISPEIATLFSRAVEANDFGIYKGRVNSWQDYLNINRRIQGGLDDTDLRAFSTLGEVVDQLKAKFNNLKNMISQEFLLNLGGMIDRINNLNWGKSGAEQLEGKKEVVEALNKRKDELTASRATEETVLKNMLEGYGATGSLEQILNDVNEAPDFWNTANYPPEVIQRIQKNKKAVASLYATNPMAKGLILLYNAQGKVIDDIKDELLNEDNPVYNAFALSDEGIARNKEAFANALTNPEWTSDYFSGVSMTDFWEKAVTGENSMKDLVTFAHLLETQNPMSKAKFLNAFKEYTEAYASVKGTKDEKDWNKAKDKIYNDYVKYQKSIGNKKKYLSKEDYFNDELTQMLAFAYLMTGNVKGTGKTAQAIYGESSTIEGLYEDDIDTIAEYSGKFFTEAGDRAVEASQTTGFTIVPIGGGNFTIKFVADVNGEKLEKEYKDVQLKGKYGAGIEYKSDGTTERLNSSMERSGS